MLVELGKSILQGDELIEVIWENKKAVAIKLHRDSINIRYGKAQDREQCALLADNLTFPPYNNYHFYESDLGCEDVCSLAKFNNEISLPDGFLKDKERTILFIYNNINH